MAGKVGAAWPIKGISFQQRFRSKEKLVYFLGDSENLFPYAWYRDLAKMWSLN